VHISSFTNWPCTPDWCDDPVAAVDSDGNDSFDLNMGQPATALSPGGEQRMCALPTDGGVRCWGGMYMPTIPDDELGSSFDFIEKDGHFSYGPFRSIDLGTPR
jgi:hypothetical protein